MRRQFHIWPIFVLYTQNALPSSVRWVLPTCKMLGYCDAAFIVQLLLCCLIVWFCTGCPSALDRQRSVGLCYTEMYQLISVYAGQKVSWLQWDAGRRTHALRLVILKLPLVNLYPYRSLENRSIERGFVWIEALRAGIVGWRYSACTIVKYISATTRWEGDQVWRSTTEM